jgi:DNA-binding CsgD family transcriptional regulator
MGEERGLVGLVGARGQALWLPNAREDARWVGMDDTIRSAYLTPIARQEETLGVLLLASRSAAGLDALHRSLADGVASGLAAAWTVERSDSGADAPGTDLSLLSQRERDVVNALCRGLRLSDIAKVLGISNHTARNHLKHVFRKLGVHSQVELLSLIGRRTGIPEAVN